MKVVYQINLLVGKAFFGQSVSMEFRCYYMVSVDKLRWENDI